MSKRRIFPWIMLALTALAATSPLIVPFIERWLDAQQVSIRITEPLRISPLGEDVASPRSDVFATTLLIRSNYRRALVDFTLPIEFANASLIDLKVTAPANIPVQVGRSTSKHWLSTKYLNPGESIGAVVISNGPPGKLLKPRVRNLDIELIDAGPLSLQSGQTSRSTLAIIQTVLGFGLLGAAITLLRSQRAFYKKANLWIERASAVNERSGKAGISSQRLLSLLPN